MFSLGQMFDRSICELNEEVEQETRCSFYYIFQHSKAKAHFTFSISQKPGSSTAFVSDDEDRAVSHY